MEEEFKQTRSLMKIQNESAFSLTNLFTHLDDTPLCFNNFSDPSRIISGLENFKVWRLFGI